MALGWEKLTKLWPRLPLCSPNGSTARNASAGVLYHVLAIVPPGLVTKWADELELPGRFRRYLEEWETPSTRAVASTFRRPRCCHYKTDLREHRGQARRGRHVLPPGFYIANSNLLFKESRKLTQLHRTRWDVVIVDEAHRLGEDLLEIPPYTLLAQHKTATLLLTATPFQMSVQELRGPLAATFGGYGAPQNRQPCLGSRAGTSPTAFGNTAKLFLGISDLVKRPPGPNFNVGAWRQSGSCGIAWSVTRRKRIANTSW